MTLLASHGGELAALSAAMLWAVAALAYRQVAEHMPPGELNLVKGLLALPMLVLTLLLSRDPLPSGVPLSLGLLLLSGALGIGLGDTAFFGSLLHLGARRALLLGTLAPPLAALIALGFLGETMSPRSWVGLFVTIAGVSWVVSERAPTNHEKPTHHAWGITLGLLAALTQAGGAVLAHAALIQTNISPLWAAVIRLSAGVLALLVWIRLARQPVGRWLRAGHSGPLWTRLLFAVVTGTYLGIWLQQVALKLTSVGIAQTLLATSPLFVLPFAALGGEKVSTRAVLGAAIALVGVGLFFSPG